MVLKGFRVDMGFDGKCNQTENFLKYLQEVCEVFQLQIVGFIPVGSGGGWPEVTFRGTIENLTKFSIGFHGDEGVGLELINDFIQDDSPSEFNVPVDERFTTRGNRQFVEDDGTFKEW